MRCTQGSHFHLVIFFWRFDKNFRLGVFGKPAYCAWGSLQKEGLWLWLLGLVTGYRWHTTGVIWQVTYDRWHMTRDMWHVTRDTWHLSCEMKKLKDVLLNIFFFSFILVLLSSHVKRFSISRMRNFLQLFFMNVKFSQMDPSKGRILKGVELAQGEPVNNEASMYSFSKSTSYWTNWMGKEGFPKKKIKCNSFIHVIKASDLFKYWPILS